ncbi:MAG: thiamine-phosphate kinase [Polyangiales bacterium]
MSGEFARIAEIKRRLAYAGSDVELGIGDDAAVMTKSAHGQALSVDAQVEGVHFRRDLLAPQDIGYRALTAALSDLAAIGATPRAALLSLILPASLDDGTLYAIIDGVREAQAEHACPVIGGNLARGAELSLTTTVLGDAPDAPLTRAGASAGDGLFVTGELGAAALGLRLLLADRPDLDAASVRRWRRPLPRIAEGVALRGVASAAIDVSDGLLADLGHLAEASGVGFDLELARLPLPRGLVSVSRTLGIDPLVLALSGGEDYEILFTAKGAAPPGIGTRVGTATRQPGLRLFDAQGARVTPPPSIGFDHFPQSPKA